MIKIIFFVCFGIILVSAPLSSMPVPSLDARVGPEAPAYSGGAPSPQTADQEDAIVFVKFMCAAVGAVMLLDNVEANNWYGGFLVGMVAVSFFFN